MIAFLDKSRIIAAADYNRWQVPAAALAIHLCIGQIYAYSVFNKPLSKPCACPLQRRTPARCTSWPGCW